MSNNLQLMKAQTVSGTGVVNFTVPATGAYTFTATSTVPYNSKAGNFCKISMTQDSGKGPVQLKAFLSAQGTFAGGSVAVACTAGDIIAITIDSDSIGDKLLTSMAVFIEIYQGAVFDDPKVASVSDVIDPVAADVASLQNKLA